MSRRSLRHDPIFDALIAKLYPSREVYEKEQTELLEEVIRKHHGEVQPGKGRKKIKGREKLILITDNIKMLLNATEFLLQKIFQMK